LERPKPIIGDSNVLLPALLLAAAIDGEKALAHASALAALGPHPWGSPRTAAAAEYVAVQFRDAGLEEVRLQAFESQGIRGVNVAGVLRAPGSEFLVVAAHHDSAPGSPGAYDDGGGVGVLIEVGRALAQAKARPRTIVFLSFDGEEAWATKLTTTAGSRSYIQSLGPQARQLVAALIVEMCGWKDGTPVVRPMPYADPLRPGMTVLAPAWMMRAIAEGAADSGVSFPVGVPWYSWLYQPVVRALRVQRHADDLSFLQGGVPAVTVSDSSFAKYYPWYHQPTDTADKLDPAALERMGRGVLGVVAALARSPQGSASEPTWFAAFGGVAGASALLLAGGLSLLPGLLRGLIAGGFGLGLRLVYSALFGLLLWRQPVVALAVFLLPNLLAGASRGSWRAFSLLPALGVTATAALFWSRGFVQGFWLAPWELAAYLLALALALAPPAKRAARALPRKGPRPGPRR